MAKQTTKFTRAVKKAKSLYKTGRYKTFADAVKAAYKKIGAVRSPNRQTGKSNKSRDEMRAARRPGARIPAGGKKVTYYERRKNRSDRPGHLTGVTTKSKSHTDYNKPEVNITIGSLKGALKRKLKARLANQLLQRETAGTRKAYNRARKAVTNTKAELRQLL